jgi:hypothetical protein
VLVEYWYATVVVRAEKRQHQEQEKSSTEHAIIHRWQRDPYCYITFDRPASSKLCPRPLYHESTHCRLAWRISLSLPPYTTTASPTPTPLSPNVACYTEAARSVANRRPYRTSGRVGKRGREPITTTSLVSRRISTLHTRLQPYIHRHLTNFASRL